MIRENDIKAKIQNEIQSIKQYCVVLDEDGKEKMEELTNNLLEKDTFTEKELNLIMEIWGAFKDLPGSVINNGELFEKKKYFEFNRSKFSISLTLKRGTVNYTLKRENTNQEIINHILN